MTKIQHANNDNNTTTVAMLISDSTDFKAKSNDTEDSVTTKGPCSRII